MIARRGIVLALGAGAIAPVELLAQSATLRRIGMLGWSTPESEGERVTILADALAKLGWKEGVNVMFDVTWAQGDAARFRQLATALAVRKPALVVVSRDTEAKIAFPLLGTVPILFASGFDPVGLGLVKSLARPGGTVTGVSTQLRELSVKRLELLKETLPHLTKVGALFRTGDANASHWLSVTVREGKARGIQVISAPIGRREDLVPAFESMAKQGAGAVLNIADGLFFETRQELADLSIKYKMASIGGVSQFADTGSMLSYAPDLLAAWRQLAGFLDRVLKGARPADIPVEQVNVYELVINLKTAGALGIKVPQSLLLQATRVIE